MHKLVSLNCHYAFRNMEFGRKTQTKIDFKRWYKSGSSGGVRAHGIDQKCESPTALRILFWPVIVLNCSLRHSISVGSVYRFKLSLQFESGFQMNSDRFNQKCESSPNAPRYDFCPVTVQNWSPRRNISVEQNGSLSRPKLSWWITLSIAFHHGERN